MSTRSSSILEFELFCSGCQAYLGLSASVCPNCQKPRLLSLPPVPGQPLWSAALGGPARGCPLIAGELALFTWGNRSQGGLTALDRQSGETRWQFQAAHSLESGLVVSQDPVFFADVGFLKSGAKLYCCQVETGEQLWSREICGGPGRRQ